VNVWLAAALVLPAGLVGCAFTLARGDPVDGLVALEVVGTVLTLELALLAVGLHRSVYWTLPLVLPLVSFAGALLLVRVFGDRFL
jgi:multisubunit Na+/H+ antiporter MnhF subunit